MLVDNGMLFRLQHARHTQILQEYRHPTGPYKYTVYRHPTSLKYTGTIQVYRHPTSIQAPYKYTDTLQVYRMVNGLLGGWVPSAPMELIRALPKL